MKLSELARYWAARELTRIDREGGQMTLDAPFACPAFTIRVKTGQAGPLRYRHNGKQFPLKEVSGPRQLAPGAWTRDGSGNEFAVPAFSPEEEDEALSKRTFLTRVDTPPLPHRGR